VSSETIAILGSSRREGNTAKVLQAVLENSSTQLFDLHLHTIHHYDYARPLPEDDFLTIAEAMVASRKIVFATPVYWYSMSGRLKVFFDRMTEFITDRKPMGRALAGKDVYLVTSSSEAQLPAGFESPFAATCEYMGMHFRGGFHGWCAKNNEPPPEVLAAARAFGLAAGF